MRITTINPHPITAADLHHARECARYLAEADAREATSAAFWFALSESEDAAGRTLVAAPYRLDPATRRLWTAGAALAATHDFCPTCFRVVPLATGCACTTATVEAA